MRFLIALNRNAEILAVTPIDLAGPDSPAIQQNLRPYDSRLGTAGPDFAAIGAVFNGLRNVIRCCGRRRLCRQHQNDGRSDGECAFSLHTNSQALAVPLSMASRLRTLYVF